MMRSIVLLIAALCCLSGCAGLKLRDSGVSVPASVMYGQTQTAFLSCNYAEEDNDVDGDQVNVTWYKDGVQFYHSVNEGLDVVITTSDVPGLEVDRDESGFRSLGLTSLTIKGAGEYHCKASSKKNTVVSQKKAMQVLAKPQADPVINGFRQAVWVANGTINLNCTADKSFPATTLKWSVEGKEAEESQLTHWPTETDENGLETSRLGLAVQLGPDPRTESVSVSCEAVYDKTVIDEWSDGASSTRLYVRDEVTRTVSPSSTARLLGLPSVTLLALLCSTVAALAL